MATGPSPQSAEELATLLAIRDNQIAKRDAQIAELQATAQAAQAEIEAIRSDWQEHTRRKRSLARRSHSGGGSPSHLFESAHPMRRSRSCDLSLPPPPGFVFPQRSQSLPSYLQDQPYIVHMHTPDAGEREPTEMILGHLTPGASPAPLAEFLETELAAELGNFGAFLRTTSYHRKHSD